MAKSRIPLRPFSFKLQQQVARFWSRINVTANPDECWEWSLSRTAGYGYTSLGATRYRSHRLAWLLANNQSHTDLHILHSCDNPSCCNPNHLRAGTQLENVQDAISKNRFRGNGRALTPQDIEDIRNRFAVGGVAKKALAREYGCDPKNIRDILHRRIWNWVK